MNKVCARCKAEKPVEEFYKNRRYKHGVGPYCKECGRRIANDDHKKHRDRRNSACLERYRANKDEYRNRRREWRRGNPGANRAIEAKRRASKLKATPGWANADAIKGMYVAAQIMSETYEVDYQVDHIIPLNGEAVCGLHVENNLRLATASENASKRNQFMPGRYPIHA